MAGRVQGLRPDGRPCAARSRRAPTWQHRPVPDDPDAPTRARLLWDEHDRAAALALLKEHLREYPRDGDARLALAELYRELSRPIRPAAGASRPPAGPRRWSATGWPG